MEKLVIVLVIVLVVDGLNVESSRSANHHRPRRRPLRREQDDASPHTWLRQLVEEQHENVANAEKEVEVDKGFAQHAAQRRVSQSEGPIVIPIKRYLDEAKANIDVIDFTNHYSNDNLVRVARADMEANVDQIYSRPYSDQGSASNHVPITLALPQLNHGGSTECRPSEGLRFPMPLQKLGKKQYYLGTFFKANWYKAERYCRFHNMHLASIDTEEEQKELQEHIQSYGMGREHFWTSGTDQGEEGVFFWMSNGKPLVYTNWNAGEPNNFKYEDGEEEHCLEMWDRDGKGLGWNDTPCSFETFFICQT